MQIIIASAFFNSYFQADFFGKLIFLMLFFVSIVSWFVIIQKIKISKKSKINSKRFEAVFEKQKEKLLSLEIKSKTFNPYFNIYKVTKQKTLEILQKNINFSKTKKAYLSKADINLIESKIDATITHEMKCLEKNLFMLSTTITLAPFLGLLGTVWGILITFSNLSFSSGVNNEVLAGLSMALSTTVLGLLIAIPALVFYNYLKNVANNFSVEMESFSNNLITQLELQYRKVEEDA